MKQRLNCETSTLSHRRRSRAGGETRKLDLITFPAFPGSRCLGLPWQDDSGVSWFNSWHYPSGSVTTRGLKNFSKRAVAPVLFVDSHVKYFDLAKHFRDNLNFPAEPTSDRVWYRAKE